VNFLDWWRLFVARDDRLLSWRRGRWKPVWAVLGFVAALVMFVALSLTAWFTVRDFAGSEAEKAQVLAAMGDNVGPMVGNPYSILNFLMIGVGGLLMVGLAATIQRQRLADFIVLAGTFRWQRFWRMAGALAVLQAVSLVLTLQFYAEDIVFRSGAFQNPLFLAAVVALIAIQTFGEELFFRGYLFHSWGAIVPRPVLVALFWSAVFALIHIWNPDVALDPVPSLLSIFLFALFAQWLVSRTGALDAAWGLHFANNIAAFLLIQAKPGYESDTALIQFTDTVLANGGSYALDPVNYGAMIGGYALLWWLVTNPRSPFFLEPEGKSQSSPS
jgi:membrane protease YdiL (CAAX protease family)